jgi:hypothetical protein
MEPMRPAASTSAPPRTRFGEDRIRGVLREIRDLAIRAEALTQLFEGARFSGPYPNLENVRRLERELADLAAELASACEDLRIFRQMESIDITPAAHPV